MIFFYKKKRFGFTSGFTFVETVLVITVIGFLSLIVAEIFPPVLDAWSLGQSRQTTTQRIHYALSRMVREISQIQDNTSLTTATANDIQFTDIDGNNVRFYLLGNTIMRNNDVLARNITGLTFSYADINNASLIIPQVSPSVTDVWKIAVLLTGMEGDESVTLQTRVRPRNFRRTP